MESHDHLDPAAELAATTRALRMEIGRRKRWGDTRTAALTNAQDEVAELIPTPPPTAKPKLQPTAPKPTLSAQTRPSAPAVAASPVGCASLEELRSRVSTCAKCSLGASPGRSGAVIGRGTPRPRLLYITDHIGPAEAARGKPLDGEAGALLAKITTGGMGLKVEETHVTPAVKCSLPPGCVPSPMETASCRSWLEDEIRLLAPTVIVTLGAGAAHALFGNDAPSGKLKGRLLHYMNIPTVATLHPRDMVARPELKASAWADLQLLLPSLRP